MYILDDTKDSGLIRRILKMRIYGMSLVFSLALFVSGCGGGGGDATPPEITIFGDNPITVTKDSNYSDPGAVAIDDVDAEVDVVSSGLVDTSTVGTYTISYTATDSSGNTATETRVVNVSIEKVAVAHYSLVTDR